MASKVQCIVAGRPVAQASRMTWSGNGDQASATSVPTEMRILEWLNGQDTASGGISGFMGGLES